MKNYLNLLAGASFLFLAGTGCCCLGKCENAPKLSQEERAKNAAEVCTFLKEAKYYFIATADGDQVQVRPFGTAHVFEGKLYIQTGRKKPVYKQIAANRKVAICAYIPKRSTWLRITGTLRDDNRIEAQKAMLDDYPSLKKMYKAGDGNNQVLYFENAKARFCSFAHPEKEIEL